MDKNTMIVCITVGILGLLSVLLGFSAEATRIPLSDIYLTYWGCTHPNSPAFGMAVAAALFLLIAQISLNAFMGCCGCCKTSKDVSANVLVSQTGTKRTSAIIMICVSWATFILSFILFLSGALANTAGGQVDNNCTTVKPGIFATASIFSLLTVGLGIGAYFLLHNTLNSFANQGIAMGNPQPYPQQGQQF